MVASKVEFLAQLPIFRNLYEDELEALARISQEYTFDDGAVIAYQRDVGDSLYIVRDGRLFAYSADERGIKRSSRSYFAGDYFNDVWLFEPDAHEATVKGVKSGRIIIIPSSDFLQFLDQNPGVLAGLEPELDETGKVIAGLSPKAWEEAQKVRVIADRQSAAINLLPDELVEYQSRRSFWYLLLRIIVPLLAMLILPLLAFSLLNNQPPGSIGYSGRFAVSIVLMFILAAITAFQYLDWVNDYFVITNKHLAHREFSLTRFSTNVNKIPIDQVQSVEVERPNLLANLLNFGTVRIMTAAQVGIVYFDNIDNPGRVQETLNYLREHIRALDAGRAQSTMRESIESHFQVPPSYTKVESSDEEEEQPDIITAEPPLLSTFWKAILKRYQWRVEENGVITYRRHFFVLLKFVAWPLSIGLVLLLVGWLLIAYMGVGVTQVLFWIGLPLLVVSGWFIWQVEDWRNDTFQLTDRYVIDVDRQPFGFGESRKQAELNNVQNIISDRPGLIPTLFNYGNVVIETAGATADIVFENVSSPNRVQSEIFKRRDQYQQVLRRREGEQRRKEYAVLLDVYQQAMEQERIPRRTPPPDEVEVER